MKKTQFLAIAIAAAALAGNALAQEKQNEVSLYGDMSSTDTGGTTTKTSMIQVSYGKYVAPNVVGKINYMVMDSDGSTISDLGLGARYYFKPAGKQGDVVPFVGAGIELVTYNVAGSSSSGSGIGAEGGVAMFVSESASIDLRVYTQTVQIDGSSATRTGFNVGTTYRF